MQRKSLIIILYVLLAACSNAPETNISPTATQNPIVLPSPYAGTLELVAAEDISTLCDRGESPFNLPSEGVLQLSFLPNRKCDDINSDLDLFEVEGRLYVSQRNARGFRIVDVTDPT